MKLIYRTAMLGFLAMSSPATASTTITFDPSGVVNGEVGSPFSKDGLDFASTFYQGIFNAGDNATNGTNYFIYGYSPLTITKTGGGIFTLGNLDLGTSYYAAANQDISYLLNLAGGGVSSGVLSLTGSFQNFSFNQSVSSVVFGGVNDGYVALDNLTFDVSSAVPEPSTWAFLLFGFAAIGGAMRSKRRKHDVTMSYA